MREDNNGKTGAHHHVLSDRKRVIPRGQIYEFDVLTSGGSTRATVKAHVKALG